MTIELALHAMFFIQGFMIAWLFAKAKKHDYQIKLITEDLKK